MQIFQIKEDKDLSKISQIKFGMDLVKVYQIKVDPKSEQTISDKFTLGFVSFILFLRTCIFKWRTFIVLILVVIAHAKSHHFAGRLELRTPAIHKGFL